MWAVLGKMLMGLNIYFGGSMRAGRQDVHIYSDIIKELKTYGRVFTEFVGDHRITELNLDLYEGSKDDKSIHDDYIAMLGQCDCMVAEVTVPSLGVGYEIGRAVAMNKRVLCLYRPQRDKRMIRGAHNGSSFLVTDYSDVSEVPDILKNYFQSFKSIA